MYPYSTETPENYYGNLCLVPVLATGDASACRQPATLIRQAVQDLKNNVDSSEALLKLAQTWSVESASVSPSAAYSLNHHELLANMLSTDFGESDRIALSADEQQFDANSYESRVMGAAAQYFEGAPSSAFSELTHLIAIEPDRPEAFLFRGYLSLVSDESPSWLRIAKRSLSERTWNNWSVRMMRAHIFEAYDDSSTASQIAGLLQNHLDRYDRVPHNKRYQLAELQKRLGESRLSRENILADTKIPAETKHPK